MYSTSTAHAQIHTDFGIHPLHFKMLLEMVLLTWLLVMIVLSQSLAQQADTTKLETGLPPLHNGSGQTSAVSVGATVTFKQYFLVKILDQYFTVQTDMPTGGNYSIQKDGETQMIIIN